MKFDIQKHHVAVFLILPKRVTHLLAIRACVTSSTSEYVLQNGDEQIIHTLFDSAEMYPPTPIPPYYHCLVVYWILPSLDTMISFFGANFCCTFCLMMFGLEVGGGGAACSRLTRLTKCRGQLCFSLTDMTSPDTPVSSDAWEDS